MPGWVAKVWLPGYGIPISQEEVLKGVCKWVLGVGTDIQRMC